MKLWGTVDDITDKDVHQRFATALFETSGMDLRGQEFDHLYAAQLTGASSIESGGDHLDITIWQPGRAGAGRPQERVSAAEPIFKP